MNREWYALFMRHHLMKDRKRMTREEASKLNRKLANRGVVLIRWKPLWKSMKVEYRSEEVKRLVQESGKHS